VHEPAAPLATTALHVLVVDDDPEVGKLLSRYLTGQGLRVSVVENARDARAAVQDQTIDVMLLDLGLPDEDGLVLMRDLRSRWQGPVIIVSGRGESVERIVGLELGADDYVNKPFDLRELLARIRSVVRRSQPVRPAQVAGRGYAFEGLQLDVPARRVLDGNSREIPLTSGEFDLLLAFVQRPHQVLTRDQLMNAVHGRDAGPFDRAIDVQIGRLRRKLEADPAHPQLIKSVRGAGYLFAPNVRAL
jgi:two-component system OmpR family response regulator